jgi:hypothetical protein
MSRDLRRYAWQTNARLLVGFVLILFLVGDGLIYLFYGHRAAGLGLVCLVAGLAPLVVVWLLLTLIGWVVKRIDE